MASTYNDVKIQLMATGENNTTWGDTTNVNWDAMSELVTGSADVAFSSANVTISLTNTNATQTARNLRLNLTGTSGGARTLTVPSIEKLYLVNNGLSDAVTIKTALGTGIAVPAGKTMWVFVDGTDVVDAVTSLTSLTLASALGVASGGTGLSSPGTAGNVLTSNGSAWVSTSTGLPSPGTSGNVLTSNGTSWTSAVPPTYGSVTSVDVSGGTTGLTTSGGPITSSGTITLAGTLEVDNGGTGLTSPGTNGNVLTSNGTAWVSSAITAGTDFATVLKATSLRL